MRVKQIRECWTPKWKYFKPPKWFIFKWAYCIEYDVSITDLSDDTFNKINSITQKQSAGSDSSQTQIASLIINNGKEND